MNSAPTGEAAMFDDPFMFPAPLVRLLGRVAIEKADAGGAVVRYEGREEHAHSGGAMVQGGIVAAWLDHAMAIAVAATGQPIAVASLEIKVSYLAPVRVGPVLAEAWIVRQGRSIAFLEARLRSTDGTDLLATASSSGKLIRLKDPS